jgi:hypothetical protein
LTKGASAYAAAMDQERGLFHETYFCLLGNYKILSSILQTLQGNGNKKQPPGGA